MVRHVRRLFCESWLAILDVGFSFFFNVVVVFFFGGGGRGVGGFRGV